MIRTPLTDLLGITSPILNAPMTPQAGGQLARAVSEAGAFGMLGFDEDESEDAIEAQLAILARRPRVPFGVGLVVAVSCLLLPQTAAAAVGGVGATFTAVSVQTGFWLKKAARRLGLMS